MSRLDLLSPDADGVGELLAPTHLRDNVAHFRDYYELTKPRLNFMVLVTTFVGFWVAARTHQSALLTWTLPATLLGTAMTAASAAAMNQSIERHHDARMRRTANRPVAAGRLSAEEGTIFAAALVVAGVGVLTLAVNALTAALGLATWAIYVLVYTPMKRRSPRNTLVGAITGALPPAMGVTAITGRFDVLAASLFAILFVWQMPHFYALALRYREDYEAGGFRMLPSASDGVRRTRTEAVAYAAMLLPISLLPAWPGVSHAGLIYAAVAAVMGTWFLRAAVRCGRGDAGSERSLFFASITYLPLLLLVLSLDQ